MKTFYIREANGQTFFTPPMELLETLKDGWIYQSVGFEEHAKILVSRTNATVRYLDDWHNLCGDKMKLLKEFSN